MEWRDTMCEKWLVKKDEVRITVVEALPKILPTLEESLGNKVIRYMKKHDAELLVNTAITGAEPGVVNLNDGSSIETATFIWTAGVSGCAFADSLDLKKGSRKGRLLVTNEIRSVDYPNVFPVGDNLWFEENEKPLPQIVETALQTGQTAASNIIADIEGKKTKAFKSNYHGFMVSVGGKYGVSNAMGIKLSGIFAMAMKHFVNLHYLISVAGFNQCWEYLKHEFLDIKTDRSFVRGFGAYKNRGYWALPIRLWLGLMWVFEGINKIAEGWLDKSRGTLSGWMFSSGVTQKGTGAGADLFGGDLFGSFDAGADAVSAASEAWGNSGPFYGLWNINNQIFDMNGPVATWFRVTFMDGMAANIDFAVFQTIIVLVEIALGLALIGGLFTFLAAGVSIIMCLVFTFSGMFAWNQVWFIFAGFLLLGGGGRAFGLDCWVMPAIKKCWNGTKFARKRYWYADNPSK
jgi:NADH dehydrogenase